MLTGQEKREVKQLILDTLKLLCGRQSDEIQDLIDYGRAQETKESPTKEEETSCIRTRTHCPFCNWKEISTEVHSLAKVKAHRVHHECSFCKAEWICKAGLEWHIPATEFKT